ncbi:DUF4214 domain-containing protein [Massilia sp. W12]|uniref:DUF4214 domain-containing protein n=1 Tax=Massilia sp. W12 TaxID=3126507 RepID=UPI0030CB494E
MQLVSETLFSISSSSSYNHSPVISSNGKYAAFHLSLPVNNGREDLILKDLQTGVTRLIQTQNYPDNAYFSSDGSKLFYTTQSYILDKGMAYTLHMADVKDGVSKEVYKSGGHNDFVWGSYVPSSDGRFIAINVISNDFVSNDHNGKKDVYIRDLQNNSWKLVSQTANGVVGNDNSDLVALSADGRTVVFSTSAGNLLPDSTPNSNVQLKEPRLLVKNMDTGKIQYADTDSNGKIYSASFAQLSADGSKVFFISSEINNNIETKKIVQKDLTSGAIKPVFTYNDGVKSKNIGFLDMSADGRYVLLGEGDGFEGQSRVSEQVFIKDTVTGDLHPLTPYAAKSRVAYTVSGMSDDGTKIFLRNYGKTMYGSGLSNPNEIDSGVSNMELISINGGINTDTRNNLNDMGNSAVLSGGRGDDHYWIDSSGTRLQENADAGTDSAFSALLDFTLPDHVENLVLVKSSKTPAGIQTGRGNAQNNLITGGKSDDRLYGGDGNDTFYVTDGNDFVDGGNGFDMIKVGSFNGKATKIEDQYKISTSISSSITFANVERIEGSYTGLFFKGDVHAEQAYRIYQAAFNRAPDKSGLGFWIKQFDNGGISVAQVAQGFIQSAEFKSLYGAAPSNAQLVDKFYQNVLHRAPDADGRAFWQDILDQKKGTAADVLAAFSESPENTAALVGVLQAGVTYDVFSA